MILSEQLRAAVVAAGEARFDISEDWLQGRSAFGGLQVAFALLAMRTLVPAELPLRTLQVTFIAPVPPGPAAAYARVLRVGNSATHVEARIELCGELLALVVGVFGRARVSVIAHLPPMREVAPGRMLELPPIAGGGAPVFTQHFRARWIDGSLPFSGDPARRGVVLLDLADAGPMSEAHLIAIADFIPPVALSMLPKPTPGSSMTWMLELFREDFAALPLEGWRIDAELVAARDGYTSQSTLIHAPDGGLAAISRQSMVVFG